MTSSDIEKLAAGVMSCSRKEAEHVEVNGKPTGCVPMPRHRVDHKPNVGGMFLKSPGLVWQCDHRRLTGFHPGKRNELQ